MKMRSSPQTSAVFAALLEQPEAWSYGYDVSRETGLSSGTLYPILMRLSERGLLETRWELATPGRPPRHLYRLTGDGAEIARDYLKTNANAAAAVGLKASEVRP